MRLSTLLDHLRNPGLDRCNAFLASPDPTHAESVDVQLIAVGEIDHNYEREELRLKPVPLDSVPADDEDYSVFEKLLGALESEAILNDPRVVVELPLLREGNRKPEHGYAELRDVYVSPRTNEVWLLVMPRAAFPIGSFTS